MGHELTRRSLLTGALAGGATLAAPQVVRALAAAPAGDVFQMALPESGSGRAPRAFDTIGLEFARRPAAHVQLRTRAGDGAWTPWVDIHGAHSRHVSDPVWVGEGRSFQVRASGGSLRG